MQVNRFNSENAQRFMFSNLPKRIEILERERFLFLPKDWIEDKDLIALKFIAQQRGYELDYADKAPKSSTQTVFEEIETAIKQVTGLQLKDYAVKERQQLLFYTRLIYSNIAIQFKIDRTLLSNRLNYQIKLFETTSKHDNLFKYTPEYRRLFNDVMQIIINNQVVEKI